MLHRRTTHRLFSLVAALAVVGVVGALPASADVASLPGTPLVATTSYGTGEQVTVTEIVLDGGVHTFGDRVTGTVLVSDDDGDGELFSGTVDLSIDDVSFRSIDIADGQGDIDLGTAQPVGAHTLAAVFRGDDARAVSSGSADFTIDKVTSDITIGEISELTFGTAGSLDFTVTADQVATGDAMLLIVGDDAVVAATGDVVGGAGTLEIPATLSAGLHSLVVMYSGNDVVEDASSEPALVDVNQATSTVTIDTAASSLVVGQPQRIAVRVAPVGGYLATGAVEIYPADGDLLGTVELADGAGSLALDAPLPAGVASLSLSYEGDDNLAGAEGSGDVTVLKASPTITVTAPASTPYGSAAVAQVSTRIPDGADGSGPLAAATVTFTATRGGTTVDAGTAVTGADGVADHALPADLAAGDWVIGASVAATSQTDAASAAPAGLAVVGTASATAVTLSKASVVAGGAVTAAVTVSGGAAAPSGSITVRVGDRALGAFALVGGKVEVPLPLDLAAGEHAVVAAYPGAAGMLASSGTANLTVTAAPVVTPPATTPVVGAGAVTAVDKVVAVPKTVTVPKTVAAQKAAAARLAATGADVQDLLALAIALLTMGGAAVLVARRRAATAVGSRAGAELHRSVS